ALLVSAALSAIGLETVRADLAQRHNAVIALTAPAMGVRSATMWRLGAGLNTTLVTGILGTWIRRSAVGGGTPDASQPYRLAARVAVFVGAAIGTLLLRAGLTVALSVAAVGVPAGIGAMWPIRRPGGRRAPEPSFRFPAGRHVVAGGVRTE
ncbi:DUF1275 family protein, partial [Streptomyces sp. NPDC006356]